MLDQGYGPEAVWEPEPVTVTLSGVAVSFPPGASSRPLLMAKRRWLRRCASGWAIAPRWRICSPAWALSPSRWPGQDTKVLAAEAARDAHLACKAAAARQGLLRPRLHRDLFRGPLLAES